MQIKKRTLKDPMLIQLTVSGEMNEVLQAIAFEASSPSERYNTQDVVRTMIQSNEDYEEARKRLSNGNKVNI